MIDFEAMCEILFVMYGSSDFSSVFAITDRSEMGLSGFTEVREF